MLSAGCQCISKETSTVGCIGSALGAFSTLIAEHSGAERMFTNQCGWTYKRLALQPSGPTEAVTITNLFDSLERAPRRGQKKAPWKAPTGVK